MQKTGESSGARRPVKGALGSVERTRFGWMNARIRRSGQAVSAPLRRLGEGSLGVQVRRAVSGAVRLREERAVNAREASKGSGSQAPD